MTSINKGIRSIVLAGSMLAPLSIAGHAVAQEEGKVADIVVTAQKRSENLQSTPIAMTALSPAQLEARNVRSVADLNAIAPNVNIGLTSSEPSGVTISIRGLAATDTQLALDSPVAIYIDGMVQARLTGAALDLVDLERVEVLRGPQGTLYGRNSTGGAVNFITRKPSKTFGVKQVLGVQTENGYSSRTTVDTGEIGDTGLSATLGFLYKKVGGYQDNALQPDERDPGAINTRAGRVNLQYNRSGNFRANLSALWVSSKNGFVASNLVGLRPDIRAAVTPTAYPLVVSGAYRDKIAIDNQGVLNEDSVQYNFTAEYDLADNLIVRSITGYKSYDSAGGPDLSGSAGLTGLRGFGLAGIGPVNLYSAWNKKQHEQFSEELQLVGNVGTQFKYVLGGYYFQEHASERNPQTYYIPSFAAQLMNPFGYDNEAKAWAVFGQGTYTPPVLDEKLSLTLGLRYTEDSKEIAMRDSSRFIPQLGQPFDLKQAAKVGQADDDFNNFSYLGKAQYQITDKVMSYVSYSTGYKAGGYNARDAIVAGKVASFGPEKIKAFEAGLKADLFDGRMRANLAYFNNKYNDLQVSDFVAGTGGASTVTRNAGRAHFQGAEAELTFVPVERLEFNIGVGYTDAGYDSYMSTDPITGLSVDLKDVAHVTYVPTWTGSVGGQYKTAPIAALHDGQILGRIDVAMQSSQNYLPGAVYPSGARSNPFFDQIKGDARTVVNGRVALTNVGVANSRATLEVALWGRNIFDEHYVAQGIDFGSLGFAEVTFGPPASAGLDVTLKY